MSRDTTDQSIIHNPGEPQVWKNGRVIFNPFLAPEPETPEPEVEEPDDAGESTEEPSAESQTENGTVAPDDVDSGESQKPEQTDTTTNPPQEGD